MKRPIIITIGIAAIFCGGTVLIAMDRISEAKRETAEWKKKSQDNYEAFMKASSTAMSTLDQLKEEIQARPLPSQSK